MYVKTNHRDRDHREMKSIHTYIIFERNKKKPKIFKDIKILYYINDDGRNNCRVC